MTNDVDVKIGGDIDPLSRSVKKGREVVEKFASDSRKAANDIGKMGVAATATGTAVVAALVSKQSAVIDSLAKTADALGVTTESLQALNHLAELNGVNSEAMSVGLRRMETRLGEAARKGGTTAQALEDLGVNLDSIINQSPEAQIQSLATALGQVDNQSIKASIATDLFGREGLKMLKVLTQINKDGVQPTIKELDLLGVSISRVDAAKVEAANDAFFKAKQVVEGVAKTITVELAPFIQEVSERFTDAARESGGFGDEVQAAISTALKFAGKLANVIHGLQVSFAGVKLVAAGFGAAVVSAVELAASNFTGFVDLVNVGTNAIIDGLNKVPGVEIARIDPLSDSPFMKGLHSLGDASRDQVSVLRSELHQLAMQELPSDQVEAFLEAVKSRSQEAAEAVSKVTGGAANDDQGGGFDANAEAVEKLKEKYLVEQELFLEHQEALKLIGDEFDTTRFESELQWKKLREAAEEEHQNKLSQLVKSGNATREAFDRLSMRSKASLIASELTNITAGVAQHNEKLFKLNQAAGIADAVINAYIGISKTLAAYPFPINAAMAAAHAISAFAQVDAIRSASFNGGGRGGPPSAAAAEPVPVNNVGTAANDGGGDSSSTLFVDNVGADSLFTGEVLRSLMGKVLEHQRNGGEVVFV